MPYMRLASVSRTDGEVTVVLRGFSPTELRKHALEECGRAFAGCPFRLTGTEVVPCMISPGGRALLYECRLCGRLDELGLEREAATDSP
jgi:hypothetical protein